MGQESKQPVHHVTAQKDRIPFLQKVAYSIGSLVNQFQAAAIGSLVIVLNLGRAWAAWWVYYWGAIRAHRCH